MRIVSVAALMVVMGLAGCIGDDTTADTTAGTDSVTEDVQAQYKVAQPEHEPPKRQFEPKLILDTDLLEVEKSANPEIRFNITDMHDYEFPLTFIDWSLMYNREPNPVAEGEAMDLPGTWNRTLHAEDYHLFGLRANDGQGFNDVKIIVLQVGEPTRDYPSADEIQEFEYKIREYYGEEVVRPVEEVVNETDAGPVLPPEGYLRELQLHAPIDCPLCVDGGSDAWGVEATGYPGATGCAGFMAGINFQDCAWVNILPASWGESFSVSSVMRADGQFNAAGDAGSVDVEFLDSCRPTGESITKEFIDTSTLAVEGIIPEGARCMVAFEFHWPTGDGVTFDFKFLERPGEPLEDPWFQGSLVGTQRTPWYDGVLLTPDVDSGCFGKADAGGNCAPVDCPGLASGVNGHGCAWIEVTPNLWEKAWGAVSHADPDGFYLESCSPEAVVLGTSGNVGPEAAYPWSPRIPEGTGCIVVSDWAGQSTVVRFEVISPA